MATRRWATLNNGGSQSLRAKKLEWSKKNYINKSRLKLYLYHSNFSLWHAFSQCFLFFLNTDIIVDSFLPCSHLKHLLYSANRSRWIKNKLQSMLNCASLWKSYQPLSVYIARIDTDLSITLKGQHLCVCEYFKYHCFILCHLSLQLKRISV